MFLPPRTFCTQVWVCLFVLGKCAYAIFFMVCGISINLNCSPMQTAGVMMLLLLLKDRLPTHCNGGNKVTVTTFYALGH